MDSRLEKSCKLFLDFIIAVAVAIMVPLFFSPSSETLVLVTTEQTVIYSLFFGLSFLLFGEVLGLREQNFQIGFAKSFFLPLTSSFLASLTLLLLVWAIEYSFIGRFAFGKIFLATAFGSFVSNIFIKRFFSNHPTSCLLFLSSIRSKEIIEATKRRSAPFQMG